jgi:histidine kinase
VAGAGLLVLFVRQRQRLAKHRQRSRRSWKPCCKQHAQELRTAQDGMQAATEADSGLSAAWNTCPRAWW